MEINDRFRRGEFDESQDLLIGHYAFRALGQSGGRPPIVKEGLLWL